MIDGSEKHNRQLAFELQNSHVCEKRNNLALLKKPVESYLSGVLLSGSLVRRFTAETH